MSQRLASLEGTNFLGFLFSYGISFILLGGLSFNRNFYVQRYSKSIDPSRHLI